MATRPRAVKSIAPEPISQEQLPNLKATEFARLSRQTGWRLAWLVASSCEHGTAGRPAKSSTSGQLTGKVPMREFAKLADVGKSTVAYYYKAWNHAYEDGVAPCAAEDVPVDVEWADGLMVPPDEFLLDDDDLAHPWSFYYDWAKQGQRPNPKKYDEDSEDEDETPSETKESKTVEVTDDDEDESDSIDEDFGLPDAMSEDEVAEADSSIQREKLLDVLETLRALISRVSDIGVEVSPSNEELVAEISRAALDLNSLANVINAKPDEQAA